GAESFVPQTRRPDRRLCTSPTGSRTECRTREWRLGALGLPKIENEDGRRRQRRERGPVEGRQPAATGEPCLEHRHLVAVEDEVRRPPRRLEKPDRAVEGGAVEHVEAKRQ